MFPRLVLPKSARFLLAPLLVVTLLGSLAYRENTQHPLDFWSHAEGYGDYVNICLAHALNIDFWVSKTPRFNGRQINDDNTLHPGLPLQATCWATYRLSDRSAASDARLRCQAVFADPSRFWLAIRLAALSLALGSAALCANAARRFGMLYAVAAGLFFFCYDPAWDYSLRLMGNESFALPLALGVVWTARKSLGAAGRCAPVWWAAWGALCALCWLNKLNYIAWTFAAVPACALFFHLQRTPARSVLLQAAAFLVGFIGSAVVLTALCLGAGGLARIARIHFGVLTHSGSYGTGPAEIVSFEAIRAALKAYAVYWHFFLLAGAVCLVAVRALVARARCGKSGAAQAALLAYLLCAMGLFFLAALKHYGPHYLIAGVPAGALMLLLVAPHIGPRMRLAISLAVALAFVQTCRRYTLMARLRYDHVLEMKSALARCDQLPRNPGEVTLWTYRLPDRRFAMEFTQCYAGISEVAKIVDEKFLTDSSVYYLWRRTVRQGDRWTPFEQATWRYAVFDRGNFEHFLRGERAADRTFFETHCRIAMETPTVCVLERTTVGSAMEARH